MGKSRLLCRSFSGGINELRKSIEGRLELAKCRFSRMGLFFRILSLLVAVFTIVAVITLLLSMYLAGFLLGTLALILLLVYTDRLEKVDKEYNEELNSIRRRYGFRERS